VAVTDISEYVKQAVYACESCEFHTDEAGPAMLHALNIGHILTGETSEGSIVTISTEER
jgi:hypothetical protein